MEVGNAPTEAVNSGAIATPVSSEAAVSAVPTSTGTGPVSDTPVDNSNSSQEKEIEFAWDEWDGKVEVVPEPWRKAVEGTSSYYTKKFGDYDKIKTDLGDYTKKYDGLQAEFDQVNRLYEAALANFGEDPNFKELEKEHSSIKEMNEALQSEYEEFKNQVMEWRTQEAKTWASQLAERHSKYFTEEAEKTKLLSMLDDGWDAEVAINLLEQGDIAVQAAKFIKAKGASDSVAFEYAKQAAENAKVSPTKRDAAKVMAGADPAQAPVRAQRTLNDATSHQERVRLVAERAFKKHGG